MAESQALAVQNSGGLASVGSGGELQLVKDPEQVIIEAQRAASALMGVISQKKHKVMFGEEQYLEVEDWETVGAFFGCTADIEWTRPYRSSGGETAGWEARAVIRDRSGRELSHAEAMCLDDEEKWSSRPKYAWCYVLKGGGHSQEDPGPDQIIWEDNPFKKKPDGTVARRPKKEKLLVGTEDVPDFQRRSMAQTRAISKVHSNVFRWVAALAGYKGTPAEELPFAERVVRETGEVIDGTRVVQEHDEQGAPRATRTAPPQQSRPSPPADEFGSLDEPPHPAEAGQTRQTTPQPTNGQTRARPTGQPTSTPQRTAGASGVRPDGVTTVREVKFVNGTSNGRPWRLAIVKFRDGRDGSTLDQTLWEHAQTLAEDERACVPVLEAKVGKPGQFTLAELQVQ